jgi:hypothetical protein
MPAVVTADSALAPATPPFPPVLAVSVWVEDALDADCPPFPASEPLVSSSARGLRHATPSAYANGSQAPTKTQARLRARSGDAIPKSMVSRPGGGFNPFKKQLEMPGLGRSGR